MAKKPKQTWKFTAPLERMTGRFAWSFVEFPHNVKELLGKRGEVRVKTVINGVAADRALMPTRSGYHIIVLGADLRKKTGAKNPGDPVTIELWPDPEPDRLDIPAELAETLDFFPEFKEGWDAITTGMKRSMLTWINSGKTAPTRTKRVAELLKRFETGHAWFALKPGPTRR